MKYKFPPPVEETVNNTPILYHKSLQGGGRYFPPPKNKVHASKTTLRRSQRAEIFTVGSSHIEGPTVKISAPQLHFKAVFGVYTFFQNIFCGENSAPPPLVVGVPPSTRMFGKPGIKKKLKYWRHIPSKQTITQKPRKLGLSDRIVL